MAVVFVTVAVVGVWVTRRRGRSSLSGVTGLGEPAATSHADLSSSGYVPTLRLPQPTEKLPQILLAVEDAQKRQDPTEEGDLLLDLAETYADARDYPCAMQSLDTCLKLASRHEDASFSTRVHLRAALIHLRNRKPERALDCCQNAVASAEKNGDVVLKLHAQDRAADVCLLSGRLGEAIKRSQTRLLATPAEPVLQLPALLRLSDLLLIERRFAECSECLQTALTMAQQTGQEHHESRVAVRQAYAALVQGHPRQTVTLITRRFSETIAWSELFDSARVLTVLGAAYLELRLFDQAIAALTKQLSLLRHVNDDRLRVLALLSIAQHGRGDRSEAATYFRETQRMVGLLGPASFSTLIALSTAALGCGEAQAAQFHAQLALDLARSRSVPDGENWATWAQGRAWLALGRKNHALADLYRALEKLAQPKDERLESLLHEALAQALQSHDPDGAQNHRQKRVAYLQQIGCQNE